MSASTGIEIRPATVADVPVILAMIRELADFEHLAHEVEATEERLRDTLFGPVPAAEALLGSVDGGHAGFALFFPSYSTFLAKPGLYLEDLFVRAQYRHCGLGTALVLAVARIAVERGCGRYEWSVLDWNAPAIAFYENLGAEMQPDWRRMCIAGSAFQALAARA